MRIRSLFGLALGAVAILSGCGGEARDATAKELASLTTEIARLRAEQSTLSTRLTALERAGKPAAPASAPATGAPAEKVEPAAPAAMASLDSDRPSLDVVRLGPSDETEAEDPGDDGPRTVLRSGAHGIIVEEAGAAAADHADGAPAPKKLAARKIGADRKKTTSVPTP